MHNIHNQAKYTPHLIDNCIQENVTRKSQPITQHDYLTKIANTIIDKDTEVTMD